MIDSVQTVLAHSPVLLRGSRSSAIILDFIMQSDIKCESRNPLQRIWQIHLVVACALVLTNAD